MKTSRPLNFFPGLITFVLLLALHLVSCDAPQSSPSPAPEARALKEEQKKPQNKGAAVVPMLGKKNPAQPVTPPPPLVDITAKKLLTKIKEGKGKITLLNVWATWCEPCVKEFPAMIHLYRKNKDRGFKLVLVSFDGDKQHRDIKRFLKDQGVDFETYRREGKNDVFIKDLHPDWKGMVPMSILFNEAGEVLQFWQEEANYEEFSKRLDAAFATQTVN